MNQNNNEQATAIFQHELGRKELERFLVGSRKYGSHNFESDYDYVVKVKEPISYGVTVRDKVSKCDYQFFTEKSFDQALRNHDVLVLEAVYLNNAVPDWFEIDKGKLRTAFSTVSNGAWVKGKKKLIVASDYEKDIALKSIFHSIRILDFGIQILTEGKIVDPHKMAWLLDDLQKLGEQYERDELWNVVESKYKGMFKELRSQFKGLAPKELTERGLQKSKVIATLRSNGVTPAKKLIKELLEIFE